MKKKSGTKSNRSASANDCADGKFAAQLKSMIPGLSRELLNSAHGITSKEKSSETTEKSEPDPNKLTAAKPLSDPRDPAQGVTDEESAKILKDLFSHLAL